VRFEAWGDLGWGGGGGGGGWGERKGADARTKGGRGVSTGSIAGFDSYSFWHAREISIARLGDRFIPKMVSDGIRRNSG
jgi:hypothetical protein